MKHLKKVLLALFAVCMLLGAASVTASAATISYYQTVKDAVAIRLGPAEKNDAKYHIAKKGTVIRVVGSTVNSSGNRWYQLNDGYWVYSKNVTGHSHTYAGGVCTAKGCGYEWPYKVSSASGTFVVTNAEGCKVWSRPYSNNSAHLRTLSYNTVVTIQASTKNQEGNIWYKLSNGNWIFSGNVAPQYTVSYDGNGGSGVPTAQKIVSGRSFYLSSVKPYRSQYLFQGWATSKYASSAQFAPGAKCTASNNVTLYAVWKACSHKYEGGVCTVCKYTFPLSVTSYNGTFVVTNSSAKIWSMPYSSGASRHIRTASNQTALTVVAKVKNSADNVWYRLSDGNYVFSGNVTEQFKLTYNANGGTMPTTYQKYLKGGSVKVTTVKPTRVGYVFTGWSTSSSTKVWDPLFGYKAGETYSKQANTTLYAVWKACSHKYEGGVCTVCKYTFPLKVTSYSGTFIVTNSGANIWSMPYSSGASKCVRTAKNQTALTVVAKVKNSADNVWYKLSDGNYVFSGNVTEQFKVTYNANGGSMSSTYQKYLTGSYVKVTTAKPTRVGYIFQGWSTAKTASSAKYTAGDRYNTKANTTLYAVWKACAHKYEGGVCTVCKYTFPLKVTSYSGTFVVTSSGGTNIWSMPYSTGASKIVRAASYNSSLKVVAHVKNSAGNFWYKLSDGKYVYSGNVTEQFTVTYNANGGTMPATSQRYLTGKFVLVTVQVPTRIGYNFKGWATSPSASTAQYMPLNIYKVKANTTLYAVWKPCAHKYEGGVCTVCKYTFPLSVAAHTGTFAVTASGGAKVWSTPYSTGASKTLRVAPYNSTMKVVARVKNSAGNFWYKLSDGTYVYSGNVTELYKVTYNANGGSMTSTYQTYLSGKSVKITYRVPARAGYIFQGWSTSRYATTATYKAGYTYSTKANTTLYAVWKACSHQYAGGVCTVCKYQFPLNVTACNGIYAVTASGGANIWSMPYTSGASKCVRTVKQNANLTVVGQTKNASGSTWYKLSDGNWVYGPNVKKTNLVSYNTADVVSVSGTYTVTASGGANVWSKPYTGSGSRQVRTVKQGAALTATGKVVNSNGGTWYKLSDGNWIYASNVARKSAVSYSTAKVVSCSGTYTVTSWSANVWSKPYSSGASKVVRTVSKNAALTVTAKVVNTAGDTWYKLSDGNWIYGNNIVRK